MKTYKIFLVFLIVISLFSCEKFLEEDYLTGANTESHFSTEAGLETLVTACYATSKIWFAKEEGYDFSTPGTDIYDYGQQHPQQYQYLFTSDFNATNSRLVVLWIEFYKGINACNDAIEVLNDPDMNPFDEEHTKTRLSEVRYLRALYNWLLVEQWGGVDLRTEPIMGVVKTAKKSSVQEFYDLIYQDLDFAVSNLGDDVNTNSSDFGRVTKLAALAFRARMKLTRASYLNDQTLYTDAANDAIAVINSGKFSMWDNYADLWDLNNNDNNPECIWAINYSYNGTTHIGVPDDEYQPYQRPGDKPWDHRDGGNHGHLMFGSQYDIQPGMTRDLENGRPFRRYNPTKYLIDAFHEDVDERFHGSFKSVWICNVDSSFPVSWPMGGYHESDEYTGKSLLYRGDTAIVYTKGLFDDNLQKRDVLQNYIWHIERNFWCLDYDNMFNADGTIKDDDTYNRNLCFELHKFYDNTRAAANGEGSERGKRDSYVMRISEMYLIAAEALWKTGQASSAYNNYLIPLANKRSINGDGAAMLADYGINSGNDLSMEYFLDERAREFAGEQMRWFDLKRMGKDVHIARMKQYAGNLEARANFDEHFTVRPIPQVQIDAITNKEEFLQNPGY
jgi:hypothetical protein